MKLLPGNVQAMTKRSRRVDTEYDVERRGFVWYVNDDYGRNFAGLTFASAFRRAEWAQRPTHWKGLRR